MDIPSDINDISKAVANIIMTGYQMTGATDEAIAKAEKIRDKIAEIIAKPLATERRRCAAIAFRYADANGMSHEHDDVGAAVEAACFVIADEIRHGVGPTTSGDEKE